MRARFESLELRQPEGRALSLPLINALVCWINASCPRHLALTRKAPKLANQGSPRRMDGEATCFKQVPTAPHARRGQFVPQHLISTYRAYFSSGVSLSSQYMYPQTEASPPQLQGMASSVNG